MRRNHFSSPPPMPGPDPVPGLSFGDHIVGRPPRAPLDLKLQFLQDALDAERARNREKYRQGAKAGFILTTVTYVVIGLLVWGLVWIL